jgi:hypothetical protein
MKAWRQRQRRQTAMLVEQAQRVMRESRKLLEQREAQLKRRSSFLKNMERSRMKYWKTSLTISMMLVGVGWVSAAELSGTNNLDRSTRIATMGSVYIVRADEKLTAFVELI